MVCIGHYESGLETDAVGTKGEEGSHDHGLFQANKQQKNSKFVNNVLIDLRFKGFLTNTIILTDLRQILV